MTRRLLVLLCLVAALAGPGMAQRIRCVPQRSCGAPVVFSPTETDYVAAIGSSLAPTTPTSPVVLRVQGRHKRSYTVDVSRSAWTPSTSLRLEARITLSGPHVQGRVLGWMALSRARRTLLSLDANQVDLSVEYRLAIVGPEAPGSYSTTVRYRVRSQGGEGEGENRYVTNTIIARVPSYVALRVNGAPSGQTAAVTFDFSGPAINDYAKAVDSGTPLAFTAANFESVDVATNDPHGYTVDLAVDELAAPAGSSLDVRRVLLSGRAASGEVLTSSQATPGFQPLVTPSDFGIRVDGGETPGTYRFRVTFQAHANP